ncbi:MAG: hypothetical protein ACI814_001882 [Mariniblastus sp.]|jgi:hypothetical protein
MFQSLSFLCQKPLNNLKSDLELVISRSSVLSRRREHGNSTMQGRADFMAG